MTRSTRRHRRAPLRRRLEPQPERHAATVDTRPVYVPRPLPPPPPQTLPLIQALLAMAAPVIP